MAKEATVSKPKTEKKPIAKKKTSKIINEEVILKMISDEAYFIAERRGFNGGHPEHDWLEAEKLIRSKKLK